MTGAALLFASVGATVVVLSAGPAHGQLVPAMELAQPAARRIGALSGDESQTLGHIAGVAVDSAGEVFLADDFALEVLWYGPTGDLRDRVGRRGNGPGEFQSIAGLAIDDEGMVHVLDPRARRISVFRTEGEELLLVGSTGIRAFGSDICALGDRIFLLAPSDTSLVVELDRAGNVAASVGTPTVVTNGPTGGGRGFVGGLRAVQNAGSILCDTRGRIGVLFHNVPLLRAYSERGALLWERAFEGFTAIGATVGAGGRVSIGPIDKKLSTFSGVKLVESPDGAWIVSRRVDTRNVERGFEIHVVDPTTGVDIQVIELPMALAAHLGWRWYGFAQEPYPYLESHDVAARGRGSPAPRR